MMARPGGSSWGGNSGMMFTATPRQPRMGVLATHPRLVAGACAALGLFVVFMLWPAGSGVSGISSGLRGTTPFNAVVQLDTLPDRVRGACWCWCFAG